MPMSAADRKARERERYRMAKIVLRKFFFFFEEVEKPYLPKDVVDRFIDEVLTVYDKEFVQWLLSKG